MRGELRYFEIAEAGYSTLERHEHAHAVMILRGIGHVLVGDQVLPVDTFDLVTVPPLTWHQFRAARTSPLGFLCMVDAERDKSQLPSARDVEEMRASPAVAKFLSTERY
jgi:mannose-6-phosphate isomerase-like protein (cupin superfamily)